MYSQILAPALLAASAVSAMPTSSMYKPGKAIYIQGNVEDNMVYAIPIGSDGMLHDGTSIATGGSGSNSVDSDGSKAGPDALVSQQAVTIAGNYLFAVNAGSNTVSMFAIDEWDPTKLTMVGQPAAVPAEFPNTVAASIKNGLVCVGATGAVAGISCAPFSDSGIGAMDTLRAIDLKQSTPPMGPTNTVSQVFFSKDEMTLYTTVKGDGMTTMGFFGSYPVKRACDTRKEKASVAQQGVRSAVNGTMVLFGSEPIEGTRDVFATDAAFGAAILSVDPYTKEAKLKAKQEIEGQMATCWSTISPVSKSAFVFDVAVNRIIEMSLKDASIISTLDLTGDMGNQDPGLIDAATAGKFLYALSPGNGTTDSFITVVDVTEMKQVQHFDISGLGVDKNAQGMAMLW